MDGVPRDLIAYYLNLPYFAMVASRLGGMLMFQPILGAMSIPIVVRALLILGLSALVMPMVEVPADLPHSLSGIVTGMGRELLLGALIGLIGALAFLGLQMGGLLIAQESGLAFGQMVDPITQDQMSIISNLYLQLGTVIFLVVGGHRALVAASLDSFSSIPLMGHGSYLDSGVEVLVAILTTGFEAALQIAAPAVITLFLLNVAMGFISRTVPQLNIMTFGFSLKALIGFMVIAISLPIGANVFLDALGQVVGAIRGLTS